MRSAATVQRTAPELLRLSEALALTRKQALRHHLAHLNPRLLKLYRFLGLDEPVVRALGPYVWTAGGEQYLDFLTAFGSLPFGHNPKFILAALDQAAELPNLVEGLNPLAGALAYNLSVLAGGGLKRVYFANSGTEAVDAAIKLARAATGRKKLLSCHGSFHGRSLGAPSLMDRAESRAAFEPLLPGVDFVPFGDSAAAAARLRTGEYAGFILEPIQGEGGFVVPPAGYLADVRALCSKQSTVLIFDEIQTGLGRAGRIFAAQHDKVIPDCLLVGKALGAGVVAISALLTTDTLWRAGKGPTPQSPFHSSTYGGNTRACAAAIACVERLADENIPQAALDLGNRIASEVEELRKRHPSIAAVRGRGLMTSIQLIAPGALGRLLSGRNGRGDLRYFFSALVLQRLIRHHRIITAISLNNPDVIRVQPPLDLDGSLAGRFTEALDETLTHVEQFTRATIQGLPDLLRFCTPEWGLDMFE